MKKLLASLTIALLAPAAQADVVKVDFTNQYIPSANGVIQVDSVASLTLSLNQDGTIAAEVDLGTNQSWFGVGIDSPWDVTVSNVSQGISSGWSTQVGSFSRGMGCLTACTGPATWTITNNNGPFTSVRQLFTGDRSDYDAFFFGTDTMYVGMAADVSAVPEPANLALIGLGFSALGILRRKRNT